MRTLVTRIGNALTLMTSIHSTQPFSFGGVERSCTLRRTFRSPRHRTTSQTSAPVPTRAAYPAIKSPASIVLLAPPRIRGPSHGADPDATGKSPRPRSPLHSFGPGGARRGGDERAEVCPRGGAAPAGGAVPAVRSLAAPVGAAGQHRSRRGPVGHLR